MQQLAETRSINQSLLSFTSCLQTLWRNQQQGERGVPPVRDSALTRVLVDIMRGVGHLALSVHFSLRDADVESTRRTLKFAEQVAELRFEAGLRLQQRVRLDGDEAPPEQGLGVPDLVRRLNCCVHTCVWPSLYVRDCVCLPTLPEPSECHPHQRVTGAA